jgi:hypothetical protein
MPKGIASGAIEDIQEGDSRRFQEPGALTSPYRPKLPSLIMDAKLRGGRPKVNIAGICANPFPAVSRSVSLIHPREQAW